MEIEIRSKGLTGSGPSQRGCDLCARTGPPVSGASKSTRSTTTTHLTFLASEKNLTFSASETLGLASRNLEQPSSNYASCPHPAIVPSKKIQRSVPSKSERKKTVINRVIETSEETRRLFVWQVRVPPIVLPFLAQVQESPVEQFCSNFQRCRSFSGFRRVGGMAGQQLART